LTSRYPAELGIEGFNKRIPDSEIFLAEILSAHGYATHAVVSHTFVGAKWGFDQGFDSFESFAGGHRTVSSEKVTQAALRIVDRFDRGPTFLFVHYFDPHFLYIEHQDHRLSDLPPDAESEWWVMAFKKLRAQANAGQLSNEQRDYLLALYDSEIAYTDQQIGRLLDPLESAGRLEDSIVIITADHGEEFLDHGGLGHTSTVFNELINVPLIIKWPGTAEPVRSPRYVAHVDMLPTLLDYIGIPVDHDVAGMHMRSRTSNAPIFSETRRYKKILAVIKDGVKLVYDEHQDRVRFFDLEADPAELQGFPELATGGQLLEELNAYRRRAATGLASVEPDVEIEITKEELEKLEALGYVD
jgi:arylsulfatase A-like enzyme